jgi:hypothetical protein
MISPLRTHVLDTPHRGRDATPKTEGEDRSYCIIYLTYSRAQPPYAYMYRTQGTVGMGV